MTKEQEITFARRWIADHTDEHYHEGGDRVLALLDALLADLRQAKADAVEALEAVHADMETSMQPDGGMEPDTVWRIDSYAAELAGEEKKPCE